MLASDLRVKNVLGNAPIERFNGNGWNEYHVSATLKVDEGEIMLIRQVGIGYCPRLNEQVSLLSPTKSRSDASVPRTSVRMMGPQASYLTASSSICSSSPLQSSSGSLSTTGFAGSKRKRDTSPDSARKRSTKGKGVRVEPIDYLDLCSDSD